ncbi:MAG: CDP-glycerol glycerophosphotransferase family protein [Selenomonadaceae bacterium]|nr:CDP-glycerol glycerophosphotransferase family protein [Selenomonadaceae bacterium]
MSDNLSVSVVVTIDDAEPYIKKCVDSILQQTFQDFEIILVGDSGICQKLYSGNDKIKIIPAEKNKSARNVGMKHAVGKYIFFVKGEDFLLSSTLKKFYIVAEKSEAQIVHAAGNFLLGQKLKCRWDKFNQQGFLQNKLLYKLEQWRTGAISSRAELCFCRRDFLAQKNLKFLNNYAADEAFNFALMCMAQRYYILRDAFYIQRKISVTNETDGLRAMLEGAAYIEKFLDKIPRFKNYELWRENILSALFGRISARIVSDKKNISAELDAALTPYFPSGKNFTKYFFKTANVLRQQVKVLAQKNSDLSKQLINFFKRTKLSANKIVFVNFMGRGYGCNPKYIAEEILRQNLPFDMVWLVNDMNEPMPEKIRKVSYGSVDSIYELATAKVIVSNTKNLLPFPGKKDGQFFIMTWHGGQGFKFIEKDAAEKLSPEYLFQTKKNSAITDLMMVNTQEQFDEFKRACWYDGEILKCGLPRNDIFFKRDEKLIARVRKNLKVPPFSKVVMYAPTFRDNVDDMIETCRLDAKKLLDVLEKKFGDEWTLLMRFHPNVAEFFAGENFGSENIINATTYPDMQELILISDALISDYSSVICDFMFSGKKVFIYAKDFDVYTKERGFKQLIFDLPYKINRSEAELFNCIETFDAAALEPKIKKFIETVKPFDDGHASEKVVERIMELAASS